MKNISIIIVAFLGLTLTSCVSNVALQTGKVLDKGDVEIMVGTEGVRGFKNSGNGVSFYEANDHEILSSPIQSNKVIGRFKRGVGHNFDLGLTAGIGVLSDIFVEMSVKRQWVGHQKSFFALASSVDVGLSGPILPETKNFQLTLPIYASIHPTDNLSIYTSPRLKTEINKNSGHYLGLVNGIKYEMDAGVSFAVEHALLTHSKYNGTGSKINIGLAYRF